MAIEVQGGKSVFSSLAYARPTQQDVAFFENNRQTFLQTLGDSAMNFYNNLKGLIQTTDYDQMYSYANQALNKMGSLWTVDGIRYLGEVEDMQFAPPKMIRWIMANPAVRELYHAGLCEGYGEKYIDHAPNIMGEEHADYRVVMHGMEWYGIDEETDEEKVYWTTYDDGETEEESMSQLSVYERYDILSTWAEMAKMIRLRLADPTSQYGAML